MRGFMWLWFIQSSEFPRDILMVILRIPMASAWNDLPDTLRDISLSRTVLEVVHKLIFFSYY